MNYAEPCDPVLTATTQHPEGRGGLSTAHIRPPGGVHWPDEAVVRATPLPTRHIGLLGGVH